MKQFLLFVLLGPSLGGLVLFILVLPALAFAAGEGIRFSLVQLQAWAVTLPAFYLLGVVPASIVGLLDAFLRQRRLALPVRILFCGAAGFLAGFFPAIAAIAMGFIQGPWLVLLGLPGLVAGAGCSALAGAICKLTRP